MFCSGSGYVISYQSGATKADSWVDIEGGRWPGAREAGARVGRAAAKTAGAAGGQEAGHDAGGASRSVGAVEGPADARADCG